MRTSLIILIIIAAQQVSVFAQRFQTSHQTNYTLDFTTYLSGVNYAYLIVPDNQIKFLTENPTSINSQAISGILDYLKDMGFAYVSWGSATSQISVSSICDVVLVYPSWAYSNSTCTNIKLTFTSCNLDVFEFSADENIFVSSNVNVRTAFYKICGKMYGLRNIYNISQRLRLPKEMTKWNEQKLKDHFRQSGADPIEGIYESATGGPSTAKYKLGVLKSEHGYMLIYLAGALNHEDWTEGEIKAKLSETATQNLFKTNWKMSDKRENNNAYISFEIGLMNLITQDQEKQTYLKLFPTASDDFSKRNYAPSSGTAFAITSTGLIATNYHVVKDANRISVRGVNGDFSKLFKGKIQIEDKKNDLALIQIVDSSFSSLGDVPFSIQYKSIDVGSSVFTMGYPLKAVMGDEIKLTNGIISSKSGYQGDVTSYQISVPLQPGNSGGPLFDLNGNLVGIVNAKLTIGENVSYAIKASYLKNLLELLPSSHKFHTINSLAGKPFIEQVKQLTKFVYIIEVD